MGLGSYRDTLTAKQSKLGYHTHNMWYLKALSIAEMLPDAVSPMVSLNCIDRSRPHDSAGLQSGSRMLGCFDFPWDMKGLSEVSDSEGFFGFLLECPLAGLWIGPPDWSTGFVHWIGPLDWFTGLVHRIGPSD